MTKNIKILGANYKIKYNVPVKNDRELYGSYGYCCFLDKMIVIGRLEDYDGWENESEQMKTKRINETLRHEILHAYLYESGLDGSSHKPDSWARNEEMIDWFAIQSPKIYKTYKQLGCLGD